jgi:hypothetical protein
MRAKGYLEVNFLTLRGIEEDGGFIRHRVVLG